MTSTSNYAALMVFAAPMFAQSTADVRPAFDVASIKPSVPGARAQLTIQPGGRLSANGFSLEALIAISYRLPAFQISAGEGWMKEDRWAIEAKAEEVTRIPAWSPPYLPEVVAVRLRALLDDRFALKVHREMRELKAYTLTVDKSGSKLVAAADNPPDPGSMAAGPGVVTASAVTMDQLVTYLNRTMDLPVVDKTGLTGSYNFKLRFAPESTHPLSGTPPEAGAEATIFDAIQEQLGLNMKAAKEAVGVLVIDSARKPAEK